MIPSDQINKLISAMLTEIFKSEDRRLKLAEIEMVRKNSTLHDTPIDGFFHGGLFFTQMATGVGKSARGALHPSLVPDMDRHIADRKTVEFDKLRVKQALALILVECQSLQDIRDTLPDMLTEMLDQVQSLPRTRPEAFLLENKKNLLRQYTKLREKIEFYMAMKLLY